VTNQNLLAATKVNVAINSSEKLSKRLSDRTESHKTEIPKKEPGLILSKSHFLTPTK